MQCCRPELVSMRIRDPRSGIQRFLTLGSRTQAKFPPNPGFGAFLTPGSGISFFPHPGSTTLEDTWVDDLKFGLGINGRLLPVVPKDLIIN